MRAVFCLSSVLALLSGCTSLVDPCAGQSGACVALYLDSVPAALDGVRVHLHGDGPPAIDFDRQSSAPGTQTFSAPIAIAIVVGDGLFQGADQVPLTLIVDGLSGGAVVGSGQTSATATRGKRTEAHVRLTIAGGGFDASPLDADSGAPPVDGAADSGPTCAGDTVSACGPSCVQCAVPTHATNPSCDGTKCGFVCDAGYRVCGDACCPIALQVTIGGGGHACALTQGGAVLCWGNNGLGQLGDGTTTDRSTPVQVAGLTSSVTAIATGYYDSCAVANGGVLCWGYNTFGKLGDGTTVNRSMPVQVSGLTGGATAVAAGDNHSCAVVNKRVQCWGYNGHGQLGNGTTTDSPTPVQVAGILTGVDISAVACGSSHTCAIGSSGSLYCWGDNATGQLGDGTTTDRSSPVKVTGLPIGFLKTVSAGNSHSCAVVNVNMGSAYCWGANGVGQLGNGTTTDSPTPVGPTGLGMNVSTMSSGIYDNCALLSGAVWCWGKTPAAFSAIPSGATVIAAGNAAYCAVVNQAVDCWGYDDHGQLGNGTVSATSASTPTEVVGF